MTVMPGGRWSGWRSTARRSSSRIASAWARPSIRRAGTGLSLVRWSGDLDREGVEIGQRRALAHPDGDATDAWVCEDRGRDPLRHRFQEIGRLSFENLARGFFEHRVTHGIADPIAGRRGCGVERYLEVCGEGLAELAFGRVVAVIAEGGQPRENQLTGGSAGA